MILLQAGIFFGMLLTVASGVILLVGTPILTYIISTHLSAKKQKEYLIKQQLTGNNSQRPTKIHLLRSFALALILLISFIIIGTYALLLLLPGDLG